MLKELTIRPQKKNFSACNFAKNYKTSKKKMIKEAKEEIRKTTVNPDPEDKDARAKAREWALKKLQEIKRERDDQEDDAQNSNN